MTADEPAPTPFPPRRPSGTPSLVYLKLRGAPAATIICSSNGRTASSTITGSSRGSTRKGFMTATPMCRSYICRDGTTRMPARRPRTFSAYRGAKRTRQQLILGPWTHGDRSLSHAGEVEFGPAAVVDGNLAEDFFALRRRWFDCWIKWQRNGVDDEPAASIFVMGGGSGGRNRDGRLEHGGNGEAGARGRCRRPVGPRSTFMTTAVLPQCRQRPLRRLSITLSIRIGRRRRWVVRSVRASRSCGPGPTIIPRWPSGPMCWSLRRDRSSRSWRSAWWIGLWLPSSGVIEGGTSHHILPWVKPCDRRSNLAC
jgi:hypothetical protein